MKRFTKILLGAIFVALIACSIQSVSADHESDKGIFKNESEVNLADTKNTNYQVYVQAVHRNGDGHLISVIESTANAGHISHKLTDDIFDTLLGKKEIVIIDNIKYEKVRYTFSPTLEQRTEKTYPIFEEFPIEYVVEEDARVQMKEDIRDYYRWIIHYCATFKGHVYTCIPMFQSFVPVEHVTYTDIITHQWTILRVLD